MFPDPFSCKFEREYIRRDESWGFGFGTMHIIPEMVDLAYLKHREGRGESNECLFTRGRGGRIGEAHVGRASCTVLRDSLE